MLFKVVNCEPVLELIFTSILKYDLNKKHSNYMSHKE